MAELKLGGATLLVSVEAEFERAGPLTGQFRLATPEGLASDELEDWVGEEVGYVLEEDWPEVDWQGNTPEDAGDRVLHFRILDAKED